MTLYPPPCKAMFGFIWLLLVIGSFERGETIATTAWLPTQSVGSFKEAEAVGEGKLLHPDWHLNYMSKRRVPNGPDPIHNRREGNSGRPPGKA